MTNQRNTVERYAGQVMALTAVLFVAATATAPAQHYGGGAGERWAAGERSAAGRSSDRLSCSA